MWGELHLTADMRCGEAEGMGEGRGLRRSRRGSRGTSRAGGAWQLLPGLPPGWLCSVQGGAQGSFSGTFAGARLSLREGQSPGRLCFNLRAPRDCNNTDEEIRSSAPPLTRSLCLSKLTTGMKYFWWHRTFRQVFCFLFFVSFFFKSQCTETLSNQELYCLRSFARAVVTSTTSLVS